MFKKLEKAFNDFVLGRNRQKDDEDPCDRYERKAVESIMANARAYENLEKELPNTAKKLTPGDLSRNTNWQMIQRIGEYISPIGSDNLHTVKVWQNSPSSSTRTLLAEIKCTNSIYSEWLVACSNSMWHTQHVVANDINGNHFPLGKMLYTVCEIHY